MRRLVSGFCETKGMTDWRDRARARMKELGITQERLAQEFGMTPAAMQKWLAGDRQPSLEQINHVARTLNVTQTWLAYGLDSSRTTEGLAERPSRFLSDLIRLEREGKLTPEQWRALEAVVLAFGRLQGGE